MESTRQRKFARQLQREVSEILREAVEPQVEAMLTVNQVRVTPDLAIARVYFTCFPDEKKKQALAYLNVAEREVRYLIAQRLRNLVKQMPEVSFYLDDTHETAARVDKLLSTVDLTEKDYKLEGYKEDALEDEDA